MYYCHRLSLSSAPGNETRALERIGDDSKDPAVALVDRTAPVNALWHRRLLESSR